MSTKLIVAILLIMAIEDRHIFSEEFQSWRKPAVQRKLNKFYSKLIIKELANKYGEDKVRDLEVDINFNGNLGLLSSIPFYPATKIAKYIGMPIDVSTLLPTPVAQGTEQ